MIKINSWPVFDNECIEKVSEILNSGKVNYWTGQEGKHFEKESAKVFDSKYSIALANGSVALTCAYKSLQLKQNDEIITSPRTFLATASSAVLLGLKPIFADVDIDSGCITCESIEPLITKKTKAISIVHLGGWPANMPKIVDMARSYNIKIIEDCSQAHGAKIKTSNGFKSVGSFGDIGTWSFCQDKIITTGGEGGMVTTSNKELWDFMWSYKDHGKDYDEVHRKDHPPGYRWLHNNFGTNYRLTEIQSAIGRYQLKNLSKMNKSRTLNASNIIEKISSLPCIRSPYFPENLIHGWYKLHVYLKYDYLKSDWDRNRIIYEINSRGFPAFQGSCSEIYLEKCFSKNYLVPINTLKNAKILGKESLMFLIHPTITSKQIDEYSETIYKVLKNACKN